MQSTLKTQRARWSVLFATLLLFGYSGVADADDQPDITIRQGAFVSRKTGEAFVPRGFNYIRLFPQRSHNTFDPEHANAEAVEAEMRRWQADGFNVVRVFLNAAAQVPGTLAKKGERGLVPAYVAKVADFLDRAQRHGIAVMLCTESYPQVPPFTDGLCPPAATLSAPNAEYMEAGRVEAKAVFLKELINGLRAASPTCLRAVFSYDIQNELCFQVSPPFTLASGSVTLADGRTYQLPAQRQELADEAAVGFINRVAAVIHEAHPGALVSASVFTYAAVGRDGPGDFRVEKAAWKNRVPFRPLALARSKADFIDLHFYAENGTVWERDLRSVEFEELRRVAREHGKPLFVGEFGAFKSAFPSVEPAAAWMGAWSEQFAPRGFAGWLYWTYDTDEQPELWNACEGQRAVYDRLKRCVLRTHSFH